MKKMIIGLLALSTISALADNSGVPLVNSKYNQETLGLNPNIILLLDNEKLEMKEEMQLTTVKQAVGYVAQSSLTPDQVTVKVQCKKSITVCLKKEFVTDTVSGSVGTSGVTFGVVGSFICVKSEERLSNYSAILRLGFDQSTKLADGEYAHFIINCDNSEKNVSLSPIYNEENPYCSAKSQKIRTIKKGKRTSYFIYKDDKNPCENK